jgi:hypothetical protein
LKRLEAEKAAVQTECDELKAKVEHFNEKFNEREQNGSTLKKDNVNEKEQNKSPLKKDDLMVKELTGSALEKDRREQHRTSTVVPGGGQQQVHKS